MASNAKKMSCKLFTAYCVNDEVSCVYIPSILQIELEAFRAKVSTHLSTNIGQ